MIPKTAILSLLLSLFFLSPGTAAAADWENSLVRIEATRHTYDYFQPWIRRSATSRNSGLVVGEKTILTTAQRMENNVLTRLQKGGQGEWTIGRLVWIDYYSNLALLTVDDEAFWEDLHPATLAEKIPNSGTAQSVRWHERRLELRELDIDRMKISKGRLANIDMLYLELDFETGSFDRSEIIAIDDEVVGIAIARYSSSSGEKVQAIPSTFIRSVLQAQSESDWRGLGFFNFFWQTTENKATLDQLGLSGPARGVIITQLLSLPGHPDVLRPKDILLKIDGFSIDSQGDYQDPDYGPLNLEYLATRNRWAGDQVPMSVWRDGKAHQITFTLPKFGYENFLIPPARYDSTPEYYVAGGLIFQPISGGLIDGLGRERMPVRIIRHLSKMRPEANRELVVLSGVLPDPFNEGYRSHNNLIVARINHHSITRFSDLEKAFADPQDGFHLIEFTPGNPIDKIVLNASGMDLATRRVMFRYGIQNNPVINN